MRASVLIMFMGSCVAVSSGATALDLKTRCEQLGPGAPRIAGKEGEQLRRLSRVFADLPDAPTTINSAGVLAAERDLPEFCDVDGYIAPTIGFRLRMPTRTWNGKFLMYGCGGHCGNLYTVQSEEALSRNYAVVVTDMGHRGVGGMYAFNNIQGMIDFGYRSTHVTAVAAKAIIAAFYGKPAARNYFQGCSTGGRQGMVEAQRFPEDFDGLVVGAAPYHQARNMALFMRWGGIINVGKDGRPILDAGKLPMIRRAVLDACQDPDGPKDDVLQDPRRCRWDPGALLCRQGAKADTCLTAAEVDVVRKIYGGAQTSDGRRLYWGMSRGSEYNWTPPFINSDGRLGTRAEQFGLPLHFFYAQSPTDYSFDYDRDPARLALLEPILDASNPDLRALKTSGAKMILWHGWDDNEIPPEAAVDYYETVTRTMGGPEATMDFFRLFMIPGLGHCRGGPGGDLLDWITVLENWIEKGEAPEKIIVGRLKQERPPYSIDRTQQRYPVDPALVDRTRPVFPYPTVARWSGRGDANDAATWEPRR